MSNQIVISSGAKVRNLDGVLTGSTGVVGSVPLGAANGVATLDSGGKVPVSQLPSSVVTYLGTWDAATNTPTLTNGTGDAGDMYICNVAGTVNFGAGPITFAVGDWVLYGSGTWQKSNGQNGTVTSVAVTESGDALTITGSPITTSGTINIGFAGTSGQYINGAGNLTTFPSLTGFVPYTGATADVNLGIYDLTANILNGNQLKAATSAGIDIHSNSGTQVALFGAGGGAGTTFYGGINGTSASFASSGSTETFAINHSSGSGIALNITKAGNGEGLYINKTSGSGNAATIMGNVSISGTGSFGSTLTANGVIVSGQLTLYSNITNGSYTYTLPSATGTLALTSQIPSITGTAYQVARYNSAGTGLEGGSILDYGTAAGTPPSGFVIINGRLTVNNYTEINRYLSIIQNVDSSWALPSTGTSLEAFITSAAGGLLISDTAYLRPRNASDDTYKRFVIQGNELILNDTTRLTLVNKSGPSQSTTKFEVAGYARFDSNVNLNGSIYFKATDASQPTYISESSGNLTALTTGQITLGTNGTSKFVFDVNGALNLGTSDNSNIININNQFSTLNTTMQGVHITPSIVSASPVIYTGVRSYPQFFLSGVSNFAEIKHFAALNASNTQDNASQIGLYIENLSSIGLAYGIQSLINSGTSRYNLYISGTANNYFKGRIGVDQTNPQYAIDVTGDVNVTGNFKVNGTNLTQGISGGGTQHYIPKYTSATTVGDSAIYQAPSSGHVLVNTTYDYSGSGGYLQVGGGFTTESFANIIYGSALYAGNSVYLKLVNGNTIQGTGDRTYFIENRVNTGATSANYYLNYWDGSSTTTRYTLDSDGLHTFNGAATISGTLTGAAATFSSNVGFGTTTGISASVTIYNTSEANQLKIAGAAPAAVYTDSLTSPTHIGVIGLATASNNFLAGASAGEFVIVNQTNKAILFGTGSTTTEKMRLTSGGRLLLGTTTDNGSLLQVAGAATFSSAITNYTPTVTILNTATANGALAGLRLIPNNGSTGFYLGIHDSGVEGNVAFINQEKNAPLALFTNATERMRITSGGNVGIGTSSPSIYATLSLNKDGASNYSGVNITNANSSANFFVGVGGSSVSNTSLQNNAYVLNAAATALILGTSDTERMRILSNGSISMGKTNSVYGTSTRMALELNGSTDSIVALYGGGSLNGYLFGGTANTEWYSTGFAQISTNGAERLRITTGGYLFINTTTSVAGTPAQIEMKYVGAATYGMNMRTTSGDGIPLSFLRSDGAQVGYIYTTSSSTSYVTSSDYRLKQDLKDFNGLSLVSSIKTYDYKWKADQTRAFGVLAHELQEVLPQAVIGEKDGEKMQGVDYSKIVPVLVKAIQELKAEIDILKNK